MIDETDFSEEQQTAYYNEVERRHTSAFIGLNYTHLPMKSQYEFQKTMLAAQKGTVVNGHNGTELDARDVRNGGGGKRGHRAKNNRLHNSDDHTSAVVASCKDKCDDQVKEAVKRSLDDSFVEGARDREREKNWSRDRSCF